MQIESPKEKSLIRLERIGEDIRSLHLEATHNARASITAARAAVVAAYECGILLNRAKGLIKHGNWEKWCADNLEGISHETACRYMRLASKVSNVTDLEKHKNITSAYRALSIMPEKPAKELKAIGTQEVDIFAEFVAQIYRDVDRIESLVSGIDISELPVARKVEVRAAIARLNDIDSRLV